MQIGQRQPASDTDSMTKPEAPLRKVQHLLWKPVQADGVAGVAAAVALLARQHVPHGELRLLAIMTAAGAQGHAAPVQGGNLLHSAVLMRTLHEL